MSAWRACSEVELFIDRNTVLLAVGLVVMDVPPDIDRLHEVALFVVKLERSLQPTEQFDAAGMIADEGMDQSGRFTDEVARPRNPVIFEIARAAFEANHHDSAPVLVRADNAGRLNPENVGKDVVASIEVQMTDGGIGAEGHPGAFLFGRTDKRSGYAVALDN